MLGGRRTSHQGEAGRGAPTGTWGREVSKQRVFKGEAGDGEGNLS
jgi:hypothetical protein